MMCRCQTAVSDSSSHGGCPTAALDANTPTTPPTPDFLFGVVSFQGQFHAILRFCLLFSSRWVVLLRARVPALQRLSYPQEPTDEDRLRYYVERAFETNPFAKPLMLGALTLNCIVGSPHL